MAAYRRVYDSRHLQADCQNRDQLRNPALGNRVWATFTFIQDIPVPSNPIQQQSPMRASERAISRDLAVSRPPGRPEVTSSTVAPLSSVKPTARVGLWVGGPQQTPTAAARQIDLVRD